MNLKKRAQKILTLHRETLSNMSIRSAAFLNGPSTDNPTGDATVCTSTSTYENQNCCGF